MELASIVIMTLLFIIVVKLTKKSRKARLIDKLPGPRTVPIFGNSLQFVGVKRYDRMKEVMKRDVKYGPIYRNWMASLPYVHIASSELAEVVLNLKDVRKGQVYTFMQPWLGRGLLTADGADWTRSRKLITPTFHFSILNTFLDVFNENAIALVSKFREDSDTNRPVDIYPIITLALLDSISETAMGNKINALKESNSKYVQAIYKIQKLVFHRYDRIWLHSDRIYNLSSTNREAKETLKILHGFADSVIRERKQDRERQNKLNTVENKTSAEKDLQNKTKTKDQENNQKERKKKAFLDLLLDECENQNADFNDQQLRDEVSTFMFEGHDTNTASLTFTLLMLSVHPELQEDIYKEQMALQGDEQHWLPTMKDLNEMHKMDRFIKETLRIYPPIPFISRTLTKDVEIGGYLIPEGSVTLISIVSILRDPKHFPDPHQFNPDRFSAENSAGRYAYAHIPFSAGPRNCIGRRFASIALKTFLSHIVRNFKLLPGTKPEELKTIIEIVQKPYTSLEIKFETRKDK